jgi:hypothetical protein
LRNIRISRLGMVLSCESRCVRGVGRGKGTPNGVVEDGCTLTKIVPELPRDARNIQTGSVEATD